MKYESVDVFSEIFNNSMSNARCYRKTAMVVARPSRDGEKLVTTLTDGTVETARILTGGEMVITNPSGEEYAIDEDKFRNLYEVGEQGYWIPKGRIKAIQNPTGVPIEIMAPWGESQYGDELCFIAQGKDVNDRYIIGNNEFKETYELIPDGK